MKYLFLLFPWFLQAQTYDIVLLQVDGKSYHVEGTAYLSDSIIRVDDYTYQVTNVFHTASVRVWRASKGRRTYVIDMVEGETIGRLEIRTEGSQKRVTYLLTSIKLDK